MYQVGHLIHYQPDDPTFETLEEAEQYVIREFKYSDWPYGIWTGQDEGSELVAIYHDQKFFRP